jgi:hypothetical protein
MTYRNDIDALSARHSALAAEVDAKKRELDSTGRMLDEMKAKARLPVLPNIRVASPCTADWNAMTPADADTERVRHCGSCAKNVYNLSQMTRDEAEALILAKEGRLCVRYFQRKDGTILLKDCTVGTANKRKRRLIAAGAAALLAGGGGAAAFMFTRGSDAPEAIANSEHEVIQGGVGGEIMMGESTEEVHEVKGDVGPDYEMKMGGMARPIDDGLDRIDSPSPEKPHAKKPHAKKPIAKKPVAKKPLK